MPAIERIEHIEQVDFASFWRHRETGELCFVEDIHYADNAIHAVSIHTIASKDDIKDIRSGMRPWTSKYRIDEFLREWEAVAPELGEQAMSATEQAAIEHMQREQEQMAALAGQKLAAIEDNRGETTETQTIAQREPTKALARAEAMKNRALAVADKIEETRKSIEQGAAALAFVAEERAMLARARINQVRPRLRAAARVLFAARLYAGKGVHIRWVQKGKPGPSGEPFVVQQDMRFMDEESLINGLDGGAEFHDLDAFAELLQTDDGFRDRLIPDEKSIIAMRVRRNVKRRDAARDLGEAYLRQAQAEQDMTTFLLIRNGERIAMVFSELDLKERLFPDERDNKAIFEQWNREWSDRTKVKDGELPIEHVDYDELDEAYREHILHYHNIMVLLQGLMDRQTGIFPDEARRGMNLLNPGDAEKALSFRYMTNLLPENVGRFDDYRERMRQGIVHGSRVLFCMSKHSKDEDIISFAPGACTQYAELVWSPPMEPVLSRAEMRGGALWASIPFANYRGGRNVRVTVDPAYNEYYCYRPFDVFNMDKVNPFVLDEFIHSSRERQHYLGILPLLATARDQLMDEWLAARKWVEASGLNGMRAIEKAHDFWIAKGRLPETANETAMVKKAASLDVNQLSEKAFSDSADALVIRMETGRLAVLAVKAAGRVCKVTDMMTGEQAVRPFTLGRSDELIVNPDAEKNWQRLTRKYLAEKDVERLKRLIKANVPPVVASIDAVDAAMLAEGLRKAFGRMKDVWLCDPRFNICEIERVYDLGNGLIHADVRYCSMFSLACRIAERDGVAIEDMLPVGWKFLASKIREEMDWNGLQKGKVRFMLNRNGIGNTFRGSVNRNETSIPGLWMYKKDSESPGFLIMDMEAEIE